MSFDAFFFKTELGARILSGFVLIAVAILATYEGDWPFAVLWFFAGISVFREWNRMTKTSISRLQIAILHLAFFCFALSHFIPDYYHQILVVFAALVTIAGIFSVSNLRHRMYAFTGFCAALLLVVIPPVIRDHPQFGWAGIAWMFAVVWSTDIVAYFAGRSIKGPKLWPQVSPNKTWSGALFGLVGGTLAGTSVIFYAQTHGSFLFVPAWVIVALSAIASITGQMGDLAESALKRRFNVKDSGHLIPGHGGVMDRLDAFWALCVFVCFIYLTNSFLL